MSFVDASLFAQSPDSASMIFGQAESRIIFCLTGERSRGIIMVETPPIIMNGIREQKKKATREKLLDTAAAEFAELGYSRANMSLISVKAGFGKGTIYNYFGSKHDLLLAVVEHAMNLLTRKIRDETAGIDDPVEKMKRCLEVDFRFMVENDELSKVIIREGFAAGPQKQVEFLAKFAPISSLLIEMLDEGKEAGRFRRDVDSGWATLVAQGIVGYMLLARWILEPAQLTHQQLADLMYKCFVEGILVR